MADKIEIAIVGEGVVGCAMAHVLAQGGREVMLVKKNSGVSRGENQSTRNPDVIHAGLCYAAAIRPLRARLCAKSNAMLYDFCSRYGVPHLACGKLIVARSVDEMPMLENYLARA